MRRCRRHEPPTPLLGLLCRLSLSQPGDGVRASRALMFCYFGRPEPKHHPAQMGDRGLSQVCSLPNLREAEVHRRDLQMNGEEWNRTRAHGSNCARRPPLRLLERSSAPGGVSRPWTLPPTLRARRHYQQEPWKLGLEGARRFTDSKQARCGSSRTSPHRWRAPPGPWRYSSFAWSRSDH